MLFWKASVKKDSRPEVDFIPFPVVSVLARVKLTSKEMIIVFRDYRYFKRKFYILLPKNDYINILNTTYFNLSSLLSIFFPAEFFSYSSLLLYIAEFYSY